MGVLWLGVGWRQRMSVSCNTTNNESEAEIWGARGTASGPDVWLSEPSTESKYKVCVQNWLRTSRWQELPIKGSMGFLYRTWVVSCTGCLSGKPVWELGRIQTEVCAHSVALDNVTNLFWGHFFFNLKNKNNPWIIGLLVSWKTNADITNYQNLPGFNNRNLFSHSLGAKSERSGCWQNWFLSEVLREKRNPWLSLGFQWQLAALVILGWFIAPVSFLTTSVLRLFLLSYKNTDR